MGAQNGRLTTANINHNFYTTLMFYDTESRMTCRDRDKNAFYGDIPPGDTDSLKIAYLICTKDNVFTVTNSLGMFTLFAKRTNPLGRCGCCCIQSFSSSTASLTRCSFRPNSPLTLSSTS